MTPLERSNARKDNYRLHRDPIAMSQARLNDAMNRLQYAQRELLLAEAVVKEFSEEYAAQVIERKRRDECGDPLDTHDSRAMMGT